MLNIDSSRFVADSIVLSIDNDSEKFKIILEICFSSEYPVSMRAARVIQLCVNSNPGLFLPFAENYIEKSLDSNIDGVKRSFLKIYSENVNLKSLKNVGLLLDKCFELINTQNESIAVKAYSIDIILKIIKFEPDLINELIPILEKLMFSSSVGLRSKAKKIYKELMKNY